MTQRRSPFDEGSRRAPPRRTAGTFPRQKKSVPLPEGDDLADDDGIPASVRACFEREVEPHVPDAWIDTGKRAPRDGKVGLVGYEINFNRYFYRYTPPRPLEDIEAELRALGADIVRMLAEVTGGGGE